jgi:SAM-dependent methyltransferase
VKSFYERRKTDENFAQDHRLRTVAEIVAALAPSSALDIACGRGTLLTMLRRSLPQARLAGSDISLGSVEEARALGFDAVQSDVAAGLPFADDSFDCVVFGEIIEHLVDPDAALTQVDRVLRLGGRLVVTTPNLASWFNRGLLLFGVQPIFTETSLHANLGRLHRLLGQGNPTQGHLKIFTLRSLLEILDAHGFVVERVLGYPFLRHGALGWFDRLVSRAPSLAGGLIVIARSTRVARSYLASGRS